MENIASLNIPAPDGLASLHPPSDAEVKRIDSALTTTEDESEETAAHTRAYPPVPPYFVHFDEKENNPFQIPPPPLHEIQPGEPYQLFGACIASQDQKERTATRPKDMNIRELFADEYNINKKSTIKSLLKSLFLNYLEYLQILEVNPMQMVRDIPDAHIFIDEQPSEKSPIQWKTQQIHLLIANINYLLNLYRPLQARLELKRLLLQQQKEWKEGITLIDEFMSLHSKEFSAKFSQVDFQQPMDADFLSSEVVSTSKHDSGGMVSDSRMVHGSSTYADLNAADPAGVGESAGLEDATLSESETPFKYSSSLADEYPKKRKREELDSSSPTSNILPYYGIPEEIMDSFFS